MAKKFRKTKKDRALARKANRVRRLERRAKQREAQLKSRQSKQVSQLTPEPIKPTRSTIIESDKFIRVNEDKEFKQIQRIQPDSHRVLRERLRPLIDEANKRWKRLDDFDLRSLAISRAYDESNGRWGFDVSQLTDEGDIIAEATRARVFINDRTSTVEGAELYTQQESYKEYLGQFGNQYNNWENKFKKFNITTISEDKARVAFAAYRRLEESEAARIMSYGSENMIIAIYDMVVHQGLTDADDIDDVTDITEQARDLLSRELGEKRAEFERAFREENEVGSILDIIEMEGDYLGRGKW